MNSHLNDCMEESVPGKYILPFLWHHGEHEDVILHEIEAIRNCGIQEFCVESRVHPEFCKEEWWSDFSIILQKAAQCGMRVWLLDDKLFPSGYANGYLISRPELRKRSLRLEYLDVYGPRASCAIQADRLLEENAIFQFWLIQLEIRKSYPEKGLI